LFPVDESPAERKIFALLDHSTPLVFALPLRVSPTEVTGMAIREATTDFMSGLQTIERAIIGRVRSDGGLLTAWDFTWNGGQPLASLSRGCVPLDIKGPAGHFERRLTYEQVTDCALRIGRADVQDLVRAAAAALKCCPEAPLSMP
jgi:hypothetical protein